MNLLLSMLAIPWQEVVVAAIVLTALAYLVRRFLKKPSSGTCASKGCACEAKKLGERGGGN